MTSDQRQFLKDEFFSLTLMAIAQRTKLYAPGIPEKLRKAFHAELRSSLESLTGQYVRPITEKSHIHNISKLSRRLSSAHAMVLRKGRFRIGLAQKALNLYLKYHWCLGLIPAPPHCPFDNRVISRLAGYTGPKWTSLDSEYEYQALVRIAKAEAREESLSIWELRLYNRSESPSRAAAAQREC